MNLGGGYAGLITNPKPGTFFVATSLGIYRSTNSTLSWYNTCDSTIPAFWRNSPTVMAGRGDTIMWGTYGHVIGMARLYISNNNGLNWRLIGIGIRASSIVFKDDCALYSCTRTSATSGLYRSSDAGLTWTYLGNDHSIKYLSVIGNFVYGTGSHGTFRSNDKGLTWDSLSGDVYSSIKQMGTLLIGEGYSTVSVSADSGRTWTAYPTPSVDIRDMACFKGKIIISDGWDFSSLISSDTGKTWTELNTSGGSMTSYCVSGNYIYGANSGVMRSANAGSTWARRNTGLTSMSVYKVIANNRYIYASTEAGLSISRNYGITWTDPYLFGNYEKGLLKTAFAKSGNYVYFATDSLVYRTSNNGVNWTEIYQNTYRTSPVIEANGANVYVYYTTKGLMHSPDYGSTWTQITPPFGATLKIKDLGSSLVASGDSGIFISPDLGQNWTKLNKEQFECPVRDFEINGNYWIAAGDTGIFRSSDNGLTWVKSDAQYYGSTYADLETAGSNVYYSSFSKKIYVSTNYGLNWSQMADLAGNRVISLASNNNYVYCGTSAYSHSGDHTSGVYRHDLSIVTNLTNPVAIPSSYRLSQNYPNPFNPSTSIRFEIPKSSFVKISVYDVTGREIDVIANERLQQGIYEKKWDASRFSSGVYFYKITAGDFTETKKMMLVK